MQKLQLKLRENIRKLYLLPALDRSLIAMSIGGIHFFGSGNPVVEKSRADAESYIHSLAFAKR